MKNILLLLLFLIVIVFRWADSEELHDLPAYDEFHGTLHSLDHIQHTLLGGEFPHELFARVPSPLSPRIQHHRFQHGSGADFFEGDLFVLAGNPLLHFHVLEPLGGCGRNRKQVSATMEKAGCHVASNGGFFDMASGDCLGNLVSEGRVVQAPGYNNAAFGVDMEGNLVTGYLPKGDIVEGKFHNLVTGVVWLVRAGKSYVDLSSHVENMTLQDTGSSFVSVKSARTAIGHNSAGEIMLVTVNGKTNRRGANLHELAEMLVGFGAVNAINLDGGGSATIVQKGGIVTNYPSDHCPDDPRFFCERPVTSIICFTL